MSIEGLGLDEDSGASLLWPDDDRVAVAGSAAANDLRLRVIVVDPDPLARRAICDLLREAGGFVVAA